jgi:hypothetical protein
MTVINPSTGDLWFGDAANTDVQINALPNDPHNTYLISIDLNTADFTVFDAVHHTAEFIAATFSQFHPTTDQGGLGPTPVIYAIKNDLGIPIAEFEFFLFPHDPAQQFVTPTTGHSDYAHFHANTLLNPTNTIAFSGMSVLGLGPDFFTPATLGPVSGTSITPSVLLVDGFLQSGNSTVSSPITLHDPHLVTGRDDTFDLAILLTGQAAQVLQARHGVFDVPEPTMLPLLLVGLVALGWSRRHVLS